MSNLNREASFAEEVDLIPEFRQTISDMAQGIGPRAVMHALLVEPDIPLTAGELMAVTGRDQQYVERTLLHMDIGGWLLTVAENGFTKYQLRSPHKD